MNAFSGRTFEEIEMACGGPFYAITEEKKFEYLCWLKIIVLIVYAVNDVQIDQVENYITTNLNFINNINKSKMIMFLNIYFTNFEVFKCCFENMNKPIDELHEYKNIVEKIFNDVLHVDNMLIAKHFDYIKNFINDNSLIALNELLKNPIDAIDPNFIQEITVCQMSNLKAIIVSIYISLNITNHRDCNKLPTIDSKHISEIKKHDTLSYMHNIFFKIYPFESTEHKSIVVKAFSHLLNICHLYVATDIDEFTVLGIANILNKIQKIHYKNKIIVPSNYFDDITKFIEYNPLMTLEQLSNTIKNLGFFDNMFDVGVVHLFFAFFVIYFLV